MILSNEVKTIEYQSHEKCCNKFGKRLSGEIFMNPKETAWSFIHHVDGRKRRRVKITHGLQYCKVICIRRSYSGLLPLLFPLHLHFGHSLTKVKDVVLPHPPLTHLTPTTTVKDWSFSRRKTHLNHLVTNSYKRVRLRIFLLYYLQRTVYSHYHIAWGFRRSTAMNTWE